MALQWVLRTEGYGVDNAHRRDLVGFSVVVFWDVASLLMSLAHSALLFETDLSRATLGQLP